MLLEVYLFYDLLRATVDTEVCSTVTYVNCSNQGGVKGNSCILDWSECGVGCVKTLKVWHYNTALQRKVLLLGYSQKSNHHDIIGHFGKFKCIKYPCH